MLVKIFFRKWRKSKSRDKTLAAMLASLNCGLSGALQPVSGWLFGGVALCAQALGAPVAGRTEASAERMTPAIPAEFGLYSCI